MTLDRVSLMARPKAGKSEEVVAWVRARTGAITQHFGADEVDTVRCTLFGVGSVSLRAYRRPHSARICLATSDPTPIRLEFNPNTTDPEVLELLSMLDVCHLTRCDVALDYEGVKVSDYVYHRPRVKGEIVQGTHLRPETIYLGRNGSRRMDRIYDKALELKRDDLTMTRLECQRRYRPDDCAPIEPGLFDTLAVYKRGVPAELNAIDQGLIALMLHYPDRFEACSKEMKRRVRDLAREACGPLDPDPANVYAEERPRLKSELSVMLTGEELSRRANVYRKDETSGGKPERSQGASVPLSDDVGNVESPGGEAPELSCVA